MEDRFKFRAIRIDNKNLVYGYLRFIYMHHTNYCSIFCPDTNLNYDCDTNTLEQCTGLKDKKGKLIYEGDILKDKYGALHPISWNVKGFYEADTFAVAGFYNAIQEDMEVIGNIHENPELLKE